MTKTSTTTLILGLLLGLTIVLSGSMFAKSNQPASKISRNSMNKLDSYAPWKEIYAVKFYNGTKSKIEIKNENWHKHIAPGKPGRFSAEVNASGRHLDFFGGGPMQVVVNKVTYNVWPSATWNGATWQDSTTISRTDYKAWLQITGADKYYRPTGFELEFTPQGSQSAMAVNKFANL